MQLKMAINMLFKWMEMVSINPEFIRKMLQVLQEKNVNMVIGSRFIENQGFQSSFARRIGISFFEKLIKILTGQR